MRKNKTKKQFKFYKRIIFAFSKMKSKISSYSLEKCIISLNKIPKRTIVLQLTLNFILGIIILTYTGTMHYFFSHLICLTINKIITLSIGCEYSHTISFLDKEILSNLQTKNVELRQNYAKFRHNAFHIKNLILCVIVLAVFFWGIFSQHYIKMDIVGCYAVYMVSITVSISVIGYAEYLWLLWFLYRVNHCSSIPYNKNIPAYTPFLVKIGTLTKHAKWCFFIEGFLYIFEYFILIPSGNITLSGINMTNNFSFFVTWGFLFVVIILAFPVIIYIQELLLSAIVSKLKADRIKTLSQISEISIKDSHDEFSKIYICNWLINSLITSPDYPVKIQHFGPAIVTVATFILHIVNLINQYPALKNFLINRFH